MTKVGISRCCVPNIIPLLWIKPSTSYDQNAGTHLCTYTCIYKWKNANEDPLTANNYLRTEFEERDNGTGQGTGSKLRDLVLEERLQSQIEIFAHTHGMQYIHGQALSDLVHRLPVSSSLQITRAVLLLRLCLGLPHCNRSSVVVYSCPFVSHHPI